MGKFTVTHEIRCDVDTFWKIFLDKDFNQRLFREELQFPEFNIVEQRETDNELIRRVSGQPKMELPGPVAKLLGSNFRYTEEAKLDKKTKVWTWKMIPSAMAEKLRQEGSMRVEAAGDKRVRRIADIINEAKVFGIGGLIESSAEKQLREGWDRSAAFMNKYIDQLPK
jgi:hypothetical protein